MCRASCTLSQNIPLLISFWILFSYNSRFTVQSKLYIVTEYCSRECFFGYFVPTTLRLLCRASCTLSQSIAQVGTSAN